MLDDEQKIILENMMLRINKLENQQKKLLEIINCNLGLKINDNFEQENNPNIILGRDIEKDQNIVKNNILYKITDIGIGKIKSRPLLVTGLNEVLQKKIYEIIPQNATLNIDSNGNIELNNEI
jgi:hypothetical protein